MFVFSVLFYIVIRFGKQLNMSAALLNTATFAVPLVFLLAYVLIRDIPIEVSFTQVLIIGLSAFFFSYIGNFLSMKGVQTAPNPGFSLMIQKSYGAFTLFVAPLLFDSSISIKGVIGTFIIIGFGLVLTLEKGRKIFSKDNIWIAFSLGSFFCFGFLTLTSKYLFSEDLNIYLYMLILYAFVLSFTLIQLFIQEKRNSFNNWKVILVIVFAGLFSFLFNLTKNLAFDIAPNIGYVNAANAGSIAALTVVSAIVFKDKLTTQKLIGVLGIFTGLILLFL